MSSEQLWKQIRKILNWQTSKLQLKTFSSIIHVDNMKQVGKRSYITQASIISWKIFSPAHLQFSLEFSRLQSKYYLYFFIIF